MWTPWKKNNPTRIHNSSPDFLCSSFKDIQNLCKEEEPSSQDQRAKDPKKVFHRVRIATSVLRSWNSWNSFSRQPNSPFLEPLNISLPGSEKRIVVYFTSLRVVRKTFEDCRTVRSILRGFRVFVDERDLSMDSGFLEELQEILGSKVQVTLPRVFIGGRYYGGAEEIRQLHETGELKKLIEGFPKVEPGVCEDCGGYRFQLCDQCNGSRKIYLEKGGGFKTCSSCNENGLTRCPTCASLEE